MVLVKGAHWETYVYDSQRDAPEKLGALVFREKVCAGRELAPQYERLDENDLRTICPILRPAVTPTAFLPLLPVCSAHCVIAVIR